MTKLGLNSFAKLSSLRLSSNNIKQISREILFIMSRYYLSLRLIRPLLNHLLSKATQFSNQIPEIELFKNSTHTFRGLYDLNSLLLDSNKIEFIEAECFRDLKFLVMLNLQRNYLRFITKSVFDDLESLTVLVLRYNRINSIEDFAFAKLNFLFSLDLLFNTIEYNSNKTFKGLTSLVNLYLNRNPVLTIKLNSFSDLKKLGQIGPFS
jgi:Leucine-rich repeat (LRR) protein